jgi:hypothetical protein
MRVCIVALLAACAIKPPPADPEESAPTWVTPSVRRCEAVCAEYADENRNDCMDWCEHPRMLCGGIVGLEPDENNGIPRAVAIPIGVAGIVVVSLLAAGAITP